jgi:transposase-like protein
MSKCRSSGNSATSGKKQRKSITFEEKLDVIKRYERDECTVDIANAIGIPESTFKNHKETS